MQLVVGNVVVVEVDVALDGKVVVVAGKVVVVVVPAPEISGLFIKKTIPRKEISKIKMIAPDG